MQIDQNELGDKIGVRGFASGQFLKFEDDTASAWVSWDGDGDIVLQIFDDASDDRPERKAVHVTGRVDALDGTVRLSGVNDGDVMSAVETFRERISTMTPILSI